MKAYNKNRKKKLLALFLSMMMTASLGSAFAACSDDTTTEEDSSTNQEEVIVSKKEDITNSTFSLTAYSEDKPILTSVTGWTRSTNTAGSGVASASDTASGVIDVSQEKWDELTTSGLTALNLSPASLTDEQAEEHWDVMTTRDKLEFYKAWKANVANKNKKIEELEFYQSFNIDDEDLPLVKDEDDNKTPIANPGTRPNATDSQILMLHNEKSMSSYLGTAQRFISSSTVTVGKGMTATFSVWVKTSNLVGSANGEPDTNAINKGAYIRIAQTIGNKELAPLEIKNINTANVTDNNGWVQYEFKLRGSFYADSTFSLELGLGQGGGTNKLEYVNGYAFFDDVACTIEKSTTDDIDTTEYSVYDVADTEAEKVVVAKNVGTKHALDFYGGDDKFIPAGEANSVPLTWNVSPTTERDSNGKVYTSVAPEAFGLTDTLLIPGLTALNTVEDMHGEYSLDALKTGSAYKQAVYNNYFGDEDYFAGEDVLMLLGKNGAAYTAKSDTITVPAGSYVGVSFFVKTSEMNGYPGAGVTLVDESTGDKYALSTIDTTINEVEDDTFTGWKQCFFFIHNEDTANDKNVSLSFSYGPTTLIKTTMDSYNGGFAAFTDFRFAGFGQSLDKLEFDCAKDGTYTKVVTLEDETEEGLSSGFDTAVDLQSANIENGFANPTNYKGVTSDSPYVGGTGSSLEQNTYEKAGLLNKQYADNYTAILNDLATINGSAANWNDIFGAATQPLVIYGNDFSYGFIGNSTAITSGASSPTVISLRLKVKGTTANVYLVDADEESNTVVHSIGRQAGYWYDKDGNVCIEDPTDSENFNAKTDVALELQTNGLYKVNPSWSGATEDNTNLYFANLAAYDYDEDSGNLMLGENANTYAYNDNWKHDGNDGVAFYNYNATNKTAYAYSEDQTTLVYDFSTLTTLTKRYEASETTDLHFEVTDTNGEWATVKFYVFPGNTQKTYRLEVWSGARTGGAVDTNSYVFVDSWSPDAPDKAGFTNLIKEIKDNREESTYETVDGTYAFYDSNNYLRYDLSLDTNKVGNSYEKYDATAETESTVYLRYHEGNVYTLFADYSVYEQTASPDEETDTSTPEEEEETTDSGMNIWLLISSLSVAIVLLGAIVSVIVRKSVEAKRKKNGYQPKPKKKDKKK